MARLTSSVSLSSPSSLLLLFVLATVSVGVRGDCPCTWYEISRAWYCGAQSSVPRDCWPINPQISKVVLEGPIEQVSVGDFAHENLLNLVHLELRGAGSIEAQALSNLTQLIYLDLRYGQLTSLPDLSGMTQVLAIEAEGNHLNTVPDLTHMTNLRNLHLNNNAIHKLPNYLLPESSYELDVNFHYNSFTIINASTLLTATDGSFFTLDDLEAITATEEEATIFPTKEFKSNIDLESILVITDDPTNP